MYHIVYLTTNLVNLKIYVGVHSTYNLEDGYLGSGHALKSAFKKYGKQNFKRQILHYCLDENHMFELESNIVNESFVTRVDTYNISLGGQYCPIVHTKETKSKMSKARLGTKRPHKGHPHTDTSKQKLSIAHKGKPKGAMDEALKEKLRILKNELPTTRRYKFTSPSKEVFVVIGKQEINYFSELYKFSRYLINKYVDTGIITSTLHNGWMIENINESIGT